MELLRILLYVLMKTCERLARLAYVMLARHTQNLTLPAPSQFPCVGLLDVEVLLVMAVKGDRPPFVASISLS